MEDLRRSAGLSRLSRSPQKQKARTVSFTRLSSDATLREELSDESYERGASNEDSENENDEKEGKEQICEGNDSDGDICFATESALRKEKKARGAGQKSQMDDQIDEEEDGVHSGRGKRLSAVWRSSMSGRPFSSSIVGSGVEPESSSLPVGGGLVEMKKKKKRKKEENESNRIVASSSAVAGVRGRCHPSSLEQSDILMKKRDREKQLALDGSNSLRSEKKKRRLLEKDDILHQEEDVFCDASFVSRGPSDKRMHVEEEEGSLSCSLSHPLVKSVSPKKTRRPSLLDRSHNIERKLQSCGVSLGSEMNGVSMVMSSPLVCAVSVEASSSSPEGVQGGRLFGSPDRKRIPGKRAGEERRQLSRLLLGHPSPSSSGMLSGEEEEPDRLGGVTNTTTAGPYTTSSSLSSEGSQKKKKKREKELEKRRQNQQEEVSSPSSSSSPSSAWVDTGSSHQSSRKTARQAAGEQETTGEGGGSTRGGEQEEKKPPKAQQSNSSSESSVSISQSSSINSSSTDSLSTSSTLGSTASADDVSSSSSFTPSSGSRETQASSSSTSSSEQRKTDNTGKKGERIAKANLSKKQLKRLEKKQRQRLRKKLFQNAGESTVSSSLYEEDDSTEGTEEIQGGSHKVSRQSGGHEGNDDEDDKEVTRRISGSTDREGKEGSDMMSVPGLGSIKAKKKKGKKKKKAALGGGSEESIVGDESSSKPRTGGKKVVVVTSGGSAASGKRRVFFDLKRNRITGKSR